LLPVYRESALHRKDQNVINALYRSHPKKSTPAEMQILEVFGRFSALGRGGAVYSILAPSKIEAPKAHFNC
jgi:hypothetical protein